MLTAIGAALAPFLSGAPLATVYEWAARSRSRSKERKGGGVSAQPPPPPPPTTERAMIALLRCQIAFLEGVINTLRREQAESRSEPAPTRLKAATAAPAASTTAAAKAKAATAPADKTVAYTSRAATTWQLAGQNHSRRCKGAQAKRAAAPIRDSSPTPRSPCVWTGTGSGHRSLEQRNGYLCQSGHLPVHPFDSLEPRLGRTSKWSRVTSDCTGS